MFTFAYIWSQFFTIVEYALLGSSYLMKKRRVVVILDILSMAAGIVAYVLLGADSGLAMSVIILVANFYYLYDSTVHSRRKKLRWYDYVMLGVVMFAIMVAAWFTYDGVLSLLSVLATVLYEVSIWQKSVKVYKFLGIPIALCWMSYNGFLLSIAGIVFEGIILVASIVGYGRELKVEKKRKAERLKRKKIS